MSFIHFNWEEKSFFFYGKLLQPGQQYLSYDFNICVCLHIYKLSYYESEYIEIFKVDLQSINAFCFRIDDL